MAFSHFTVEDTLPAARVAVNRKVATSFDYAEWSFGLRVDTPPAICHTRCSHRSAAYPRKRRTFRERKFRYSTRT